MFFCTAREAPYAKARTQFSRDIQMTIHNNHGFSRTASENGPSLLSWHTKYSSSEKALALTCRGWNLWLGRTVRWNGAISPHSWAPVSLEIFFLYSQVSKGPKEVWNVCIMSVLLSFQWYLKKEDVKSPSPFPRQSRCACICISGHLHHKCWIFMDQECNVYA